MLQIQDLTYRLGGRVLLDAASVAIPAGHHVGLVGRNGVGKSTLLRLIAGELAADGGDIRMPARHRLGWVAQEAPSGPESLIDTVLAADDERAALLEEAEYATDPHRIADIHTRLADIDAHSAEARAATILAGLGFDEAAQARPCADYSGGWRMRVALAATLFRRPDLLLLDEPTNHLDLEAALWLEGFLAAYCGTIILVSHDRDLLNKAVTGIIHLDRGKLTLYGGTYDTFERTRRQQLDLAARRYDKQIAQRRHIQSFIDRFRAKASKARQAQSRIKMLERMDVAVPVIEDTPINFDFPAPAPLAPPLITLNCVSVGYDDAPPVLSGLNLRIDMDDRIALLGANGNGKSTLAKLLCGQLRPRNGHLAASSKLRIGYFAQHQGDALSAGRSPLDHLRALMPDQTDTRLRAQLGRFGFAGSAADTLVGDLSGGEKARLLFALMSRHAPHIMVLDEPTNHLDIDSREALMQALNAYDGAVVLISHDPHLIEACADRLWLVAEGAVVPFDGDLADYRRHLLDSQRTARRRDSAATAQAPKRDRRAERQAAAARREETAPLRKRIAETEKQLERLMGESAALEAQLADPALYNGPAAAVTERQKQLADLQSRIETLEGVWLEDQERLELG